MDIASCWHELGISPSTDIGVIKRAYAARLKEIDRERDVASFQRLRLAYTAALREAELAEPVAPESKHQLGDARDPVPIVSIESAGGDVPFDASSRRPEDVSDDQVVSEVLRILTDSTSADALMSTLHQYHSLDNLLARDTLGFTIAESLIGTSIQPYQLEVLDAFFGWKDRSTLRRWPDQNFALRFHRWQRSVELEHELRAHKGWFKGRDELRTVRRWLSPPHTALRAFIIGLLPGLSLNQATAEVRKQWPHDADLLITPDMSDFHMAVAGTRYSPRIWWSVLLGHLLFVSVLGFGSLALIWPSAERGPVHIRHYWFPCGLIAQAVFYRAWPLLHASSSRLSGFLVRQHWLYLLGNIAVPLLAMLVVWGL